MKSTFWLQNRTSPIIRDGIGGSKMEHPDEYSGIGNVTHYLKDIFENAQRYVLYLVIHKICLLVTN